MRQISESARTTQLTTQVTTHVTAAEAGRLAAPAAEVRRVIRASCRRRRRAGDPVGVAAEVQRLGLGLDRVQLR